MKKRFTKILSPLLAITPFFVALVPHFASANNPVTNAVTNTLVSITYNTIFSITAALTQLLVAFAGGLLTIVGAILNSSMTATLNMSAIVDSTPAIGTAWTTIRDFGSVFIIFMLLYASIEIILGIGSGAGKLIKNIVIAGLLINFSLFFTKLAVDASNIISLSFYNAIAPTALSQNGTTVNSSNSGAGTLVGLVGNALNDGGLANVFMQSLDLQSFANTPSSNTGTATTNDNKYWDITLANVGAALLMFIAAISFLAASAAFAVRIAVLILLMAFSPLYFIAMIFPDLKKYSERWTKMLYSMCVFMPVYLFLMYVAMSVLNDPHFFCFAQTTASAACPAAGAASNAVSVTIISSATIGIVLQYIIAILLINAPLAAAISIAGEGSDIVANTLKGVSKWGQGFVGQHNVGRTARAISESKTFGGFVTRNPNLGLLANSGLKKVSGGTFGGSKGGFDERVKKHTDAMVKLADKAMYNSKDEADYKRTLDLNRGRKTEAINRLALLDQKFKDNPNMNGEEYEENKKKIEAEIEKIDAEYNSSIDPKTREKNLKNMARERFAKNTEAGNLNIFTKKVRIAAAKKIREDGKKTPIQKELEKVLDSMKEKEGGKEGKDEKPSEGKKEDKK